MRTQIIAVLAVTFLFNCVADGKPAIVLGSKKFTESFVLAELAKRSL